MKNLLKSFAIIALVFISVGMVKAQTAQKIGHINSGELLQAMPEVKAADSTFENFRKSKVAALEAMDKERQQKIAVYQEKYKSLSEANKETIGKEIETLGQDIQAIGERLDEMNQKTQEELKQKQGELYQPILAKAEVAVKAVAKEKGFAYVFDTQNQAMVYHDGGIDITPDVKAKLGIK